MNPKDNEATVLTKKEEDNIMSQGELHERSLTKVSVPCGNYSWEEDHQDKRVLICVKADLQSML